MNAAYPESASATHQNPGETLRQAREHRGWSQTEVARRLNLTITSLNNLETGAFDKLPGHTFARGYIRAYAKLMDLDQAPLVAAFDQVTGSNAKGSDVHSLGRIEEPRRLSQNILRGVSLLVLVAVVGGGFVWWQDQGSLRGKDLTKMALEHVEVESADGTTQIHPLDEPEDQAVSAAQQPESTALALQSPAKQGATEEAAPAASTHQPSATAPVTAPAATVPGAVASGAAAPATPVSAAASSTAPVREETAAAPAGTGKVAITFVADCWAQVTDGNGKVLTSSVKRKGETLELSGKPPFAVRLGFARGAQVSYNGQAVNLAPFTSGETARLKLGQ